MLLNTKPAFRINFFLFVITTCISCSDINSDYDRNIRDSYSELNSDLDILQLGIQYHENPGSKLVAYEYLNQLVQVGCFTQAIYLFEDIAQQFAPDDRFWELYLKAALGAHHFDKLKNIPILDISDFPDYRMVIDAADSIEKYDKIIQSGTHNEYAFRTRGEAYFTLKDWSAAEYDYTRAIEYNPGSFSAFYDILYLEFAKENYSKAISTINQHKEIISKFSRKEQEIVETIKQTLNLLDEVANNDQWLPKEKHFKKAKILSKVDNTDIALIEVNKAIELDNQYADAYALRAFIYLSKKKLELALQDIQYAEGLSGMNKSPLHQMIIEKMEAGR